MDIRRNRKSKVMGPRDTQEGVTDDNTCIREIEWKRPPKYPRHLGVRKPLVTSVSVILKRCYDYDCKLKSNLNTCYKQCNFKIDIGKWLRKLCH